MRLVRVGVYHAMAKKIGLFTTKEIWSEPHPNLQGRVMQTLLKFGDVYLQQQDHRLELDENGDETIVPSNYYDIFVADPQWGASKYSDHSDVEIGFFYRAIMARVFDNVPSVEMDMTKVKTIE